MPHIVIDCRFARLSAGIGRYTRDLVGALVVRNDGTTYTLIVRNAGEEWLRNLAGSPSIIVCNAPHYSIAEQIVLPRIIRRCRPDLFFSPHFNVPVFLSVPFVCTIHDLILHRYPNEASLPKRMAYRFLMKRAVTQAKRIVTVSHATGRDVADRYHITKEKIDVLYPGISRAFTRADETIVAAVQKKYDISGRYFLYVGAAKEHKNITFLLRSFARLSDSSMHLVLVTGGKEAEELHLPERTHLLRGVPDADLPALYSGAQAFVSASIAEGFGFPFLEAMACGCPVVGIQCTSIPEVCGDMGILIEPDERAFTSALEKAAIQILTAEQRNALITHAAIFRWEKTADMLAYVFCNALS